MTLHNTKPAHLPEAAEAPADGLTRTSVRRARAAAAPAAWRDYLELTKPEITFLVTISALAGFLLGSPEALDLSRLLALLVGVGLTAGGSGVLNHYLERERDAQMKRTQRRPLPAGRISEGAASAFGTALVVAGVGLLCPLTNPLTGILSALTVVLYLFVYTPLKQKTKYNTVVGTLPGALPALGGWAAATGGLEAGGWALFGILAFWQMPHFLSLAWMYRKDYERGDFAMLPVVEPDGASTARQTLLFTLGLLGISLLPTLLGVAGLLYAAGALLLGLDFLGAAWAFYRIRSTRAARRVLMASIRYVPLLVLVIFLDRFV